MTKRTFSPTAIIHLPRLDETTASILGRCLLTAAEPAPEALALPIAGLRRALEDLDHAGRSRLVRKLAVPDTRGAHYEVNAAWSATHRWLDGWARLGEGKKSEVAAQLLRSLFPDGLAFLHVGYKAEWAQSGSRLAAIAVAGLDRNFAALGGVEFLDRIRAAHDRYGRALGVTEARAPRESSSMVRPALDALREQICAYVLAVSALALNPASTSTAARLLLPLTSGQHERRQRTWKPDRTEHASPDHAPEQSQSDSTEHTRAQELEPHEAITDRRALEPDSRLRSKPEEAFELGRVVPLRVTEARRS